jgi:hypothetical protein
MNQHYSPQNQSFFSQIEDPHSVITAIDTAVRFPEILNVSWNKYASEIVLFRDLIMESNSSAELLQVIRGPRFNGDQRMSLLKMFRRCVSPILDTEMAKKIRSVQTQQLVANYGDSFKDIRILKQQFSELSEQQASALAALIGEYDTRGQLGYILTDRFFQWFEFTFANEFVITGPRGAGRDVELSSVFSDFNGNYPCDFVVRDKFTQDVLAIGFARYDSTRGGAQSDDRTGGNSDKVTKAQAYWTQSGNAGRNLRIIFLSDGPGLAHGDTWLESCILDGAWEGNVRVATLKLAPYRITSSWLRGQE